MVLETKIEVMLQRAKEFQNQPELEEARKDPPLEAWPYCCYDFGVLVSRTVRE